MSKSKTIAHSPSRAAKKNPDLEKTFDLDVFVEKYIWLLVPILVLLYFWFSRGSTGFYQDDEIGHYRNIRQFWGDPFSIMGNQPKPGWKILMVVPGLLGFDGVALAHCLVSALTVVFTYKLGKALRMKNSIVPALLLAAQPLFLQLSFRSYSEITAGLLAVLMLYFYYSDRYILAALMSSYIFSIRQEFALVSIGLGIIFLMRKKWIPFLLLAWTPLTLAVIGWLVTGHASWLLDDMRKIGLGVQVPHKPFWHYFQTYIFMVGPVTLALFVVGYFRIFASAAEWKERIAEHGFLFFTFTIMWWWAVISAWDALNFGANPGHWRYLLSIAPLTAIYAGKGMNVLLDRIQTKFAFIALGVFLLVVLAFLSHDANGLVLLDTVSYSRFTIVLGVLVAFAMYRGARLLPGSAFAVLLLVASLAYTVATEKPRKLDTEASTVKDAATWYLAHKNEYGGRPLYCNHVLMRYFADIEIGDSIRNRSMQKSTLATAPPGSLVMWDSHYGNSQFGGDVPMDFFTNNPGYKQIDAFIAPDRTFGVLVFLKN